MRSGTHLKIKTHRDGLSGTPRRGRRCVDERLRIEAILWILRTGAGRRDLPRFFGPWQTVYTSFRAWARTSLWQTLLASLGHRARDDEHLMVDSTVVRVHAHGSGPAWASLRSYGALSRQSLDQDPISPVTPWATHSALSSPAPVSSWTRATTATPSVLM